MAEKPANPFEKAGDGRRDDSIVAEFVDFLRDNKKWWLVPIVVVSLLVGVLIWAASGPAAPFIYTLF